MKRRMKMNSSNKRRRGRSSAGLMMTSTIAHHHQNMATTTSKEGRTMMTKTIDDGNWCNGKEEDGNLGDPRRNHSHHSSPSARMFQEANYNNQLERPQKSSDKTQRLWMQRDIKNTTMQMRKTSNLICQIAIIFFLLLQASQIAVDAAGQVVIKRFSKEQCKFNPCLNGGKCIAGKTSCECPSGWMGKYCHRRCRNIYQSCDRWAMEEKCELVRTQTNFFDINCAVSCKLCTPDPSVKLTPIPLPPALEPLQFMMGKWYSQATKGLRYPTDMLSSEYEELLDISPTQVPMFGPPSLNLTSTCWYTDGAHDVRITHGFITLKPNSNPPEIAILSTANEGLNMIELGTLQNHAVTLNISYMQVHPSLDNDVLPLGATRRFKRTGQFLEMTVAKLFPGNKVSQFKKMFKKVRNYPF